MDEQNQTKSDTFDELDRAVARLVIENPSISDLQIAKQFGVTRQTVNRRRNSDAVKKLVAHALSLPTEEIKRLVAKSLCVLERHIGSKDPRISLTAIGQIMKLGVLCLEATLRSSTPDSPDFNYIIHWGDEDDRQFTPQPTPPPSPVPPQESNVSPSQKT